MAILFVRFNGLHVWKSLVVVFLVTGFYLLLFDELDVSPASAQTPEATVTGTITYRERIALTPNAVVEVKLLDVSRADAPAITIGEQIIENPGQVPISFEIEYNPDDIDDRFTYAVRASITESGELAFTTDTRYSVITRGNPTHVDMVLIRVASTPAAPSVPPNVGDTVLSHWVVVGMVFIGAIIFLLGLRMLITSRPNS